MPSKVFVNYRRDDDPNGAARVRDGLAAKFGKASVFMDVDNLLAGQRFDEELAKALAQCDVLIAIIGPRWMELLKARAASGERDYVREEIAEALRRKLVVVPVRVGREGQLPALPRAQDLPEDIRDLVLYQKHDVAHERFGRDIAELIEAITTIRRNNRPQYAAPRVPWGWVGATASAMALAGWVGAHSLGLPVPWPGAPASPEIVLASPKGSDPAARQKAAADATTQAEAERVRLAALEQQRQEEARKRAEAEAAARKRAEEEAKRKAEEEAARRDPLLALAPGSGQSARDRLANGQPCPMCPEMVVVPAGRFTMGSPASEPERSSDETQVQVNLSNPFAVGRFAVTFDEWDACAADGGCNGYKPSDRGWGRGKRPVINVNWDDAKAYVAWLSRKTGKGYRLLSEAEREYVTRAGTTTPFWWGSSITPAQANYEGSATPYKGGGAKGEYRQRTVPVDSFSANPWGLYNVHGNVWEWAEDCWADSNNGNPGDGTARTSGDCSRRVVRGGSWVNIPGRLRAAIRDRFTAGYRDYALSFRVGRTF